MPLPGTAEHNDGYRLSPLQRSMFFHQLVEGPHTGFDVQQLDVTIHDAVDVARLTQAWRFVAAEHAVLRTRFVWEGLDEPRQEVTSAIEIPVVVHDLSAQSPESRAAAIAQFLDTDRHRGFDLHTPPLWRVTLFRLDEACHRLVWTYSHVILDRCAVQVLREAVAAYHVLGRGRSPAGSARRSYQEHLAGLERDWLARAPAARAFWRDRLRGFVRPSTIAQHGADADRGTGTHGSLRFWTSASTDAALRHLCDARGFSRTAFVQAAWARVVGVFAGEADVVFGEARPCRPSLADNGAVVGQLLNVLPVRAHVGNDRRAEALIRSLDDHQSAVRTFEHTPLSEICTLSELPRGTRLFDSLVVVSEPDTGGTASGRGNLWGRLVVHERMNVAIALRVVLEPRVHLTLTYDRARFDAGFARRVATLMKRLLHAMAMRPEATVGELPRLPAGDVRNLAAFARTSVAVVGPACVHHAVEAQVDRTPDAVAVTCRGRSLTYAELDARANRVAAALIAQGVVPDRPVAIFVDRSLEMIVGLLGILKAGGAYLPLDAANPGERLEMMLQAARPDVLLTVERLRGTLPATTATILAIGDQAESPTAPRVGSSVRTEHLAYVMFTSGSTGRPKGVQVEHRQVMNFFCGMDRVLGPAPGVWLALSAITFDISVLEVFWTLARGFTVVLQAPADRGPAAGSGSTRPTDHRPFYDFTFRRQLETHHVTHVQCTPSQLERFALEPGGLEALGSLQHLLVGGEALPAPLVARVSPHLRGTFHNMYGPTETTIWSTAARVTTGADITIGRPIANTIVRIRGRGGDEMPVGSAGELLIGGAGVSRGYVGRADLTAERFEHDAATGERWYRTGDLAAWRADGQILFLGRMDHQVKILGHRVELEEVDTLIGQHPAVRECVTIAQPGPSGGVRLIAYVVPRVGGSLPTGTPTADADLATTVHQYARGRLPGFMVPSAVVALPALPMTPNGKADRQALASRTLQAPVHPGGARGTLVLDVMRGLIGSALGVHENFIDAGADSLHLLQASRRLSARCGRAVTFADILAHPTAQALEEALAAADADAVAVAEGQQRAHRRQDAARRRRPTPRGQAGALFADE